MSKTRQAILSRPGLRKPAMAAGQSFLLASLSVVLLSIIPPFLNSVEAKFGYSAAYADVFADKRTSLSPETRSVVHGAGLISRLVAGDPCLSGAKLDTTGKPCKASESSAVRRLSGTLRVGPHPPGVGRHNPNDLGRVVGHHPPGVGHHPPGVGHHPPGVGHHPPGVGHHPPGVGHHPPGVGHHPPRVGKTPPPSPTSVPPSPVSVPPTPSVSPPVGNNPPGVGHHPPGVGHHPPGVGSNPPGVGRHPPGVGHHPPGVGKRCHKNHTRCLDPQYNPRILVDPTATTCCSKSCLSVVNDWRACGGCGRSCGTSTDGIAHGCCDGQCVDLNHRDTCGGCFSCASGEICVDGTCTSYE